MGCNCRSKDINGKVKVEKTPDSPCIFCAHKHIATAKQLYDLEIGYKDINKSHAIGQLILAAWHYDKEYHNLALRCREIWLRMENLEDRLKNRFEWGLMADIQPPACLMRKGGDSNP